MEYDQAKDSRTASLSRDTGDTSLTDESVTSQILLEHKRKDVAYSYLLDEVVKATFPSSNKYNNPTDDYNSSRTPLSLGQHPSSSAPLTQPLTSVPPSPCSLLPTDHAFTIHAPILRRSTPDFLVCTASKGFHIHATVIQDRTRLLHSSSFASHPNFDHKTLLLVDTWWDEVMEMLLYFIYMGKVNATTRPLSKMAAGNMEVGQQPSANTLCLLPLLRKAVDIFHVVNIATTIEEVFLKEMERTNIQQSETSIRNLLKTLYSSEWESDEIFTPFRTTLASRAARILSRSGATGSASDEADKSAVKTLLIDYHAFALHVLEMQTEKVENLTVVHHSLLRCIISGDIAELESALGEILEY